MPSFSESGKWEQNHPVQIAYSLDKTPPNTYKTHNPVKRIPSIYRAYSYCSSRTRRRPINWVKISSTQPEIKSQSGPQQPSGNNGCLKTCLWGSTWSAYLRVTLQHDCFLSPSLCNNGHTASRKRPIPLLLVHLISCSHLITVHVMRGGAHDRSPTRTNQSIPATYIKSKGFLSHGKNKGIVPPKNKKCCHYLLILRLFQTCSFLFLLSTKEDLLRNTGIQTVGGIATDFSYYGSL